MSTTSRTMTGRRYRYAPRMTARQLSDAMNALEISAGQLSKVSGIGLQRVHKFLKGEEDIPVFLQRDLAIWQIDERALDLAWDWAERYAYDVRNQDPSRGNPEDDPSQGNP